MGGRGLSAGEGQDGQAAGQRWGVLGGTFDPIHFAHLAMAEQVREALDLHGVLFVPAAQPVHKPATGVSPVKHRLSMVELATADNPCFEVSRIEIDRPTPSYSVETMARLVEQRPQDAFHFIVSAEAVVELPSWREPRRLLELCRLAVVPRLGYAMPTPEWLANHFTGLEQRFELVETTRLGHSASDIRARVASGRTIRYLVPSVVEAYIRENRLYRVDD